MSNRVEFKTLVFQFLRINSIACAVNLFILSVVNLDINYFWYKFYQFYLITYISRILNLYCSVVNIQISINRYVFLKNKVVNLNSRHNNGSKNNRKFLSFQVVFVLVIFFLYSPYLFLFEINNVESSKNDGSSFINYYKEKKTPNSSNYFIAMSQFGMENYHLIILLSCFQIVIHIMNLSIMVTFSVLTIVQIRKNYKLINSRTNSIGITESTTSTNCNSDNSFSRKIKKKEYKTTKLVLYFSFLFIINEFSAAFLSIIETHNRVYTSTDFGNIILLFTLLVYVLTNSSGIFIYKSLNKSFNKRLKELFCALSK